MPGRPACRPSASSRRRALRRRGIATWWADSRRGGRIPAAHAHLAGELGGRQTWLEPLQVLLVFERQRLAEVVAGLAKDQRAALDQHLVSDAPRTHQQEIDVAEVVLQQVGVNESGVLNVRRQAEFAGDPLGNLAVLDLAERPRPLAATQPVQPVESLNPDGCGLVAAEVRLESGDLADQYAGELALITKLDLD